MKPAGTLSQRNTLVIWLVLLGIVVMGIACQPSETTTTEAVEPASGSMMAMEGEGDPGVYQDRVLFGQSAAFSGPAQQLGLAMKLGIEAAFHEQNQDGGVHGRRLTLITMDDFYEPDSAYANTRNLIRNEEVFALIGEVGTPTSRSASPLANAEGVPFVAPFTGAEFLRNPALNYVFNLRASYYQETEEMVARLTEDLGITRVAILYQNDSYGQAGLQGTVQALESRGLEPVESWYYRRNSSAVKAAALNIAAANPEAVVMIGSYAPVAKTITLLSEDIDPVFMTVSFVGANSLANELGPDGEGVYVTQVVPLPDDTSIPAVAAYQSALKAFAAEAEPGFVSLEGYLAGRLAIEGLQRCGPDLSRECFLNAIRGAGTINIEGMKLQYGTGDNQGSDAVFLTVLGPDGEYQQVTRLGGVQ